MNAVEKIINERNIPDVLLTKRGKKIKTAKEFDKHRQEIKTLLEEHIYGVMPKKPDHLMYELESEDRVFLAGKAPLQVLKFTVIVGDEKFSFPVKAVIPKSDKKLPAFIHINFRPDVPDKYMPSEELADEGFAVFSFCYKDVTTDDKNFKNGVAKLLSPKRRTQNSPGKIAMWAWAAMRVMDYVETLDTIDKNRIAVVGHSRLGKTALLTAAFDERFSLAISNDSGCSGAAITRGKCGEHISDITEVKGEWFCKRYEKYAPDESKLPLDQHYLLSLIAPRRIIIGSAIEDTWSDPTSEFLSAYLVSPVYELYGYKGLIHNGDVPKPKTVLDEGRVCYQIRNGLHYFSREDWHVYMDYFKKHL
jgi:hypothetical protein